MITPEIRAEIRRLVLVEGLRIGVVARKFGVHHGTVRRALRDEVPAQATPLSSALDTFKPYIVKRIIDLPELTSARLLLELRDRGCTLGIAQPRRYVAQIRPQRPRRAYLRIETEAGEQAQVDWGSFGHFRIGGTQRPLSVFSMVLSWSRALFIDFSFDQQMETFCRMHRSALEFFAGVPRRIVYDNLKSVVLHHVGATVQFNPRFLAFAGHYLFETVAAPVRYPEFKGRVESSIKYVRHSFFYGRSFTSLDDLRDQAAAWRDQVANQRIHATTKMRPWQRLLAERPRLRALPARPFDTDLVIPVIVSKEARVRLDTNTYSVPPKYVGKQCPHSRRRPQGPRDVRRRRGRTSPALLGSPPSHPGPRAYPEAARPPQGRTRAHPARASGPDLPRVRHLFPRSRSSAHSAGRRSREGHASRRPLR
jgi:transposase